MFLFRLRLARGAAALVWSSALPVVYAQPTLPESVTDATHSPPVAVEIQSQVTATDNGGLTARGHERADLIVSVRPELRLARHSAALQFELSAAATLLGYANGTQKGGVLPDVRASLKSMLVDHWVYLDAQALVRQSEADAFGARADPASGANRRTESSYRFSPYIEREFFSNTKFQARYDLGLTTNTAGDSTRLVTNQTLLRVERKPVPLGAALEILHLTTETSGTTSSRFTLDTGRVRGNLAVTRDLVLGVIAGQDRSKFLLGDYNDQLYGASALWRPGPRTVLSLELEHRFFGQSGALFLRHRTPWMSFSLSLDRQPVVASSSLKGMDTDVRTFLDAILTTRYPDPTTRSDVVDDLVTSRGIDSRFTQPVDLVANYPQLITDFQTTWAWLSPRNTASISLYSRTTKQFIRDSAPLASAIPLEADSRQYGGAVQFNRRLAPQISASLLARWSKIYGLAVREGDVSDEKSVRLSVQQNVSPRTGVSVGVQHTRFTTTVAGQSSYDATLAFVGIIHRF